MRSRKSPQPQAASLIALAGSLQSQFPSLEMSLIYREPVVMLLARPVFLEPDHLRVRWLGESTDGERLAEVAGRLCYMSQKDPVNRVARAHLENNKKQGN